MQLVRIFEEVFWGRAVKEIELPASLESVHPSAIGSIALCTLGPANPFLINDNSILYANNRQEPVCSFRHDSTLVIDSGVVVLQARSFWKYAWLSVLEFAPVSVLVRIEDFAFAGSPLSCVCWPQSLEEILLRNVRTTAINDVRGRVATAFRSSIACSEHFTFAKPGIYK